MPLGERDGHVLVRQAVKAVAADAALPQRVRQRQHLLHLRQRAVERGVEARDLRQVRRLGEQDLDRLQRERLVQRRQRDVALQVRQHRMVHADRRRVLAAAVHDAVGHGRGQPSAGLLDARSRARAALRRRTASSPSRTSAVGGAPACTSFALLPPMPSTWPAQRLARQRGHCRIEQRELDARRAAIEHEDRLARGPCASSDRALRRRASAAWGGPAALTLQAPASRAAPTRHGAERRSAATSGAAQRARPRRDERDRARCDARLRASRRGW